MSTPPDPFLELFEGIQAIYSMQTVNIDAYACDRAVYSTHQPEIRIKIKIGRACLHSMKTKMDSS